MDDDAEADVGLSSSLQPFAWVSAMWVLLLCRVQPYTATGLYYTVESLLYLCLCPDSDSKAAEASHTPSFFCSLLLAPLSAMRIG